MNHICIGDRQAVSCLFNEHTRIKADARCKMKQYTHKRNAFIYVERQGETKQDTKRSKFHLREREKMLFFASSPSFSFLPPPGYFSSFSPSRGILSLTHIFPLRFPLLLSPASPSSAVIVWWILFLRIS